MRVLKSLGVWAPRVLAGFFVLVAIAIGTGFLSARVVLSDSMEPTFYKNDLVLGASWLEPLPGDVAIYQQRDIEGVVRQDVVHRIVTISGSGEYMFKGDNNESADSLMASRSDIKSVIIMKLPGFGSLATPLGALAIVGIIVGIWALSFGIKTLMRTKSTADEE